MPDNMLESKDPKTLIAAPITDHHDGFGLNDKIKIEHDGRDFEKGGGASHRYELWMGVPTGEELAGKPLETTKLVAAIQFQHGPRNEPGSVPGVTEAAILAVLIDRLRSFQAGPYACRENEKMLSHLEEALGWEKRRATDRNKRGVLGKLAK
jgi:hypothetical protein